MSFSIRLLIYISSVIVTGWVASRKGRNVPQWCLAALFFHVFVLIAILCVRKRSPAINVPPASVRPGMIDIAIRLFMCVSAPLLIFFLLMMGSGIMPVPWRLLFFLSALIGVSCCGIAWYVRQWKSVLFGLTLATYLAGATFMCLVSHARTAAQLYAERIAAL